MPCVFGGLVLLLCSTGSALSTLSANTQVCPGAPTISPPPYAVATNSSSQGTLFNGTSSIQTLVLLPPFAQSAEVASVTMQWNGLMDYEIQSFTLKQGSYQLIGATPITLTPAVGQQTIGLDPRVPVGPGIYVGLWALGSPLAISQQPGNNNYCTFVNLGNSNGCTQIDSLTCNQGAISLRLNTAQWSTIPMNVTCGSGTACAAAIDGNLGTEWAGVTNVVSTANFSFPATTPVLSFAFLTFNPGAISTGMTVECFPANSKYNVPGASLLAFRENYYVLSASCLKMRVTLPAATVGVAPPSLIELSFSTRPQMIPGWMVKTGYVLTGYVYLSSAPAVVDTQPAGWVVSSGTWKTLSTPYMYGPKIAYGPTVIGSSGQANSYYDFQKPLGPAVMDLTGQMFAGPTPSNAGIYYLAWVNGNAFGHFHLVRDTTGSITMGVNCNGTVSTVSTMSWTSALNAWVNFHIVATWNSASIMTVQASVWDPNSVEPGLQQSTLPFCMGVTSGVMQLTSDTVGVAWNEVHLAYYCVSLNCGPNGQPADDCSGCICNYGWAGTLCNTIYFGTTGNSIGRLSSSGTAYDQFSFNLETVIMTTPFLYNARFQQVQILFSQTSTVNIIVYNFNQNTSVFSPAKMQTITGGGGAWTTVSVGIVVRQGQYIGFNLTSGAGVKYVADSNSLAYVAPQQSVDGAFANSSMQALNVAYAFGVTYGPLQCPAPDINFATVSCTVGQFDVQYETSVCNYTCNQGYSLSNNRSITCGCSLLDNNNPCSWSFALPSCSLMAPDVSKILATNIFYIPSALSTAQHVLINSGGPAVWSIGAVFSPSGALTASSFTLASSTDFITTVSWTPPTFLSTTSLQIKLTNSVTSKTVSLTLNTVDVPPGPFTYPSLVGLVRPLTIQPVGPTFVSGTYNNVVWKISPNLPCLNFSTATGMISGLATCLVNRDFVVLANNSGGGSAAVVRITITDTPPTQLTYTANQIYTIGYSISPNQPVTGPSDVITNYTIAGSPPLGLQVSPSTGIISGTPTVISDWFNLTVTALNTAGSISTVVRFKIVDIAPVLALTTTQFTFSRTVTITPILLTNTGGSATSAVSSPQLPAGLILTPTQISGTSTVVKTRQSYTITVSNSNSTAASVMLSIQIIDLPCINVNYVNSTVVYYMDIAIATNAIRYSAAGGSPDSFNISQPLPPGLSMDSTGAIYGTPTAESPNTQYSIGVINTGGVAYTTLTILVLRKPPDSIRYTVQSKYTLGNSLTLTPVVTGEPSVNWTVVPTLPSSLSINPVTGVISGSLLVLLVPGVNFTVTATNSGGSTSVNLLLTIVDVPPQGLTYATTIALYPLGSEITPNRATVAGGGPVVSFSVSPGLPDGLDFNVSNGMISGTPDDSGPQGSYIVSATNTGGSATCQLKITVTDGTNFAFDYTFFPQYTINLTIVPNYPQVTSAGLITYSIDPASPQVPLLSALGLSLDPASGNITGRPNTLGTYEYVITAVSGVNAALLIFDIEVVDVPPLNLSYPSVTLYLGVNMTHVFPTIRGGAVIDWKVDGADNLGIYITRSGILYGVPSQETFTTFDVIASNSGGSAKATIDLVVLAPPPIITGYTLPVVLYQVGSRITPNTPTTTGGTPMFTSTPPPVGLSLSTSTGILSGIPAQPSVMLLNITASNSGGQSYFVLNITIVDVPPSGLSLPVTGNPNNAFRWTTGTPVSVVPSVSGFRIVWSIVGNLPSGLTFNNDSSITGTPTAQAVGRVNITATNTGGSQTIALVYASVAPSPADLSYSPQSMVFYLGNFSTNRPQTSASIDSYTLTPALPKGLFLNSTTGVIHGTPTLTSSRRDYTITATNTGGQISCTVSITVQAYPPVVVYPTLLEFVKGVPQTISPSLSGGAVVSWSISSTLPRGLVFSTGVISGTPLEIFPQGSILVYATNTGDSVPIYIQLQVVDQPPANFSYPSSQLLFVKDVVLENILPKVSGGDVVQFTVSPPLPAGVTLSRQLGVISGLPTQLLFNTTSYTITATNTGGQTTTNISITIIDRPPRQLTYGTPQAFYTTNMTMAQNNPSYSGGAVELWSISPALPEGITLSETGVISGVPLWQSSQSYTVIATNSGGQTNVSISIAIRRPPPLILSYPPLTYLTLGDTVSMYPTVDVSNNVMFSIYPALPMGLSFSASTGQIFGTASSILWPAALFEVTVANEGGYVQANVPLSVQYPPLTGLNYTRSLVRVARGVSFNITPTITGVVVSWSVQPTLPPCVQFNSLSGGIYGMCGSVLAPTTYTVTASTLQASTSSASANVSIEVFEISPRNLTYETNVFNLSVDMTLDTLEPSFFGGTPQAWISTPAFPDGLVLDSITGELSGTPTTVSNETLYVITAMNTGGNTSVAIKITVMSSPSLRYNSPFITYTINTPIVDNTAVVVGIVSKCGPVQPTLPAGLFLSNTTCTISGTPVAVSPLQTYTVYAKTSEISASGTVAIRIEDPLLVGPWSYVLTSVQLQILSPTTILPATSVTAVQYTVFPNLPAGLTLDANAGVISGTPVAVTATVVYTVIRAGILGATPTLLTIAVTEIPPTGVTYDTIYATYTCGEPITPNKPTCSGGVPNVYSINPALPSGLSMDFQTGIISGIPFELGSASYTVTASNSGGSDDSLVSITINDQIPGALSYLFSPSLIYTQNVAVLSNTPLFSGGGPPTDYKIVPDLPTGLLLSLGGVISGTPLERADGVFKITASNTGGQTSTTLSIVVLPDCAATTTCTGHGVCSTTGLCVCDSAFIGDNCNQCAQDHYSYPRCDFCIASQTCSSNGVCSGDDTNGACSCFAGFSGLDCGVCTSGYYGENCLPCPNCGSHGNCVDGMSGSGECSCADTYYGNQCQYGSTTCGGNGVAQPDGICLCNAGFAGNSCERCAPFYIGYPNCAPCDAATQCSGNGQCGKSGCVCNAGFAGSSCSACDSGYYDYPRCVACSCSNGGTCDSTGVCSCPTPYAGSHCDTCMFGYALQPSGQCFGCLSNTPSSLIPDQICTGQGQCSATGNPAGSGCLCDDFAVGLTGSGGCSIPLIASVDPPTMPRMGAIITIYGVRFGAAGKLMVEGFSCDVPLYSDSLIEANCIPMQFSASGSPMAVDITVQRSFACGTSDPRYYCTEETSNDFPLPIRGPVVTSVILTSPQSTEGEGLIEIHGTDFPASAVLTIGGTPVDVSPYYTSIRPFVLIPGDTFWYVGDGYQATAPPGKGVNNPIVIFGQTVGMYNYDPPYINVITPSTFPTDGTGTATIEVDNIGLELPTVVIGGTILSCSYLQPYVSCQIPEGPGLDLPVVVQYGGQSSLPYLIQYKAPIITSVTGCPGSSHGLATATYGCGGGETLTIQGNNFGASIGGQQNSGSLVVTVGGQTCTGLIMSHPHTQISCTVPAQVPGTNTMATVTVARDAQSSSQPWVGYGGIYINPGSIFIVGQGTGSSSISGLSTTGAQSIGFSGSGFIAGMSAYLGPSDSPLLFPCSITQLLPNSIRCTTSAGVGANLHPSVLSGGLTISGVDTANYSPPVSVGVRVQGDSNFVALLVSLNSFGDIIEIGGSNFSTVVSRVNVVVGTAPCQVLAANGTLITCKVTQGLFGVKVNITVSNGPMLTVPQHQSTQTPYPTLQYTYPTLLPLVLRASGCSNNQLTTLNCPPAGGVNITITGNGFSNNVTTLIGGKICPVLASTPSSLTCRLPPGSGTVNIVVIYGSKFSRPFLGISYALPSISNVSGCTNQGAQTVDCARSGGTKITISGTNFWATMPSIFVGVNSCANVTLLSNGNGATCTLPAADTLDNLVVIYLSSGNIISNNNALVSYSPCQPGQYVVSGVCTPCPVGTFSPTGSQAACQSCSNNVNRSLGATSCAECHTGQFLNSSDLCQNCPNGMFSPGGVRQCLICPAGTISASSSGASGCNPCSPGRFSLAGDSTCSPCGPGEWSSSAFPECLKCAKGRFSSGNASVCTPCSPGSYAIGIGALNCSLALPGYYVPSHGATVEFPCPIGSFSTGGAVMCQSCPANSYTSKPGAASCRNCTEGVQSDVWGLYCRACPLGQRRVNGVCQDCPPGNCHLCTAGKWAGAGQVFCALCPSGSYASSVGQGVCSSCAPGSAPNFLGQGASNCSLCTVGRFSHAGEPCTDCPAGTSAASPGSSTCDDCLAGEYSLDYAAACTACPAGTHSPIDGQSSCMTCGLGTSSPSNSSDCLPCSAGKYQNQVGQENCLSCSIGYFAPPGSAECTLCLPGQYSGTEAGSCSDCPQGQYKDSTFSQACSDCPIGYYSFGLRQTACIPCGFGTRQAFTGATFCTNCEAGKYADLYAATACLTCLAGTSSSAGAKTCTNCALGFYSNSGASTCSACAQGLFGKPGGVCAPCTTGYYADSSGLTTCLSCAAGKYASVSGAKTCTNCGAGLYQNLPGKSSCLPCTSGQDLSASGLSACMDCAPGTYSAVTLDPNMACKPCSNGKYSQNPRSTVCTVCEAGRYSLDGAATPILCPTGSYSQEGKSFCTSCDAGKHQNRQGSTSCVECPTSTIAPVVGTVDCSPCPSGQYANVSGINCLSCSKGTFIPAGGSVCTNCRAGEYNPSAQQEACFPCAAGSYSNTSAAVSCIQCPSGTEQNSPGQTFCSACAVGQYSPNPGTERCMPCGVGSYTDTNHSITCAQCDAGTFQPTQGLSSCSSCPAGKYSYPGSAFCLDCAAFSVAPNPGASICDQCPTGTLANTNRTLCMCAAGTFDDTRLHNGTLPMCFPCPSGIDCSYDGATFDTMGVEQGWWRASDESMLMHKCRIAGYCLGGHESTCLGYRTGVLCAYCEVGYTDTSDGECSSCPGGGGGSGASVAQMLGIVILLGIVAGLFYTYLLKREASQQLELLMKSKHRELTLAEYRSRRRRLTNLQEAALFQPLSEHQKTVLTELEEELARHEARSESTRILDEEAMSGQTNKLAVSFFQLSAVISYKRPIPFPKAFLSLISIFTAFNVDFLGLAKSNCVAPTNFYTDFLVELTLPFVCVILLLVFYTIPQLLKIYYKKAQGQYLPEDVPKKIDKLMLKFRKLTLTTFCYLYVLVCNKTLKIFVCDQIEGKYYLIADYTISCFNHEWWKYASIAIVMIFVYPIGIPLAVFVKLYRNRKKFELLPIRYEMGFLYEVYRRDVWYFEIVDMAHKLFISALLPFVSLQYQMQVGMVAVFIYAIIILLINPYTSSMHDWLHLLSQCCFFLILMAGYFFQGFLPTVDPRSDVLMSVFLILDITIFIAALIYSLGITARRYCDRWFGLDWGKEADGINNFLHRSYRRRAHQREEEHSEDHENNPQHTHNMGDPAHAQKMPGDLSSLLEEAIALNNDPVEPPVGGPFAVRTSEIDGLDLDNEIPLEIDTGRSKLSSGSRGR